MPFPISVIGVVVVGAVTGGGVVVGAALHDDHSDYSDHYDHSDYSDAAQRAKREKEAKIKQCENELSAAKGDFNETLAMIKGVLIREIEAQHLDATLIKNWHPGADNFSYEDFDKEFSDMDNEAREKITSIVNKTLKQQIQQQQDELKTLNELIRKVNETRLTGN